MVSLETPVCDFGLAAPDRPIDRARAIRFANLYAGEDAPNWDPDRRMIRSPINGSKGPRYENSWDDWSTHRWILAQYPVPFDDLEVPVEMKAMCEETVFPMLNSDGRVILQKTIRTTGVPESTLFEALGDVDVHLSNFLRSSLVISSS